MLKIQHVHQISGINAYHHTFARYTGSAPAVADLNTLASNLYTEWASVIAPVVHPQTALTSINITDLSSATAAQGAHAGSAGGTEVGGPLTANDCVLLNFKISRRYRGGKPRLYLPWGTDGDLQNAQTWKAASVTNFTNAWASYSGFMVAQTWTGGNINALVNVSYYSGHTWAQDVRGNWHKIPTPRTGGPLIDVISASSVNTRIATQRRRQHFSV